MVPVSTGELSPIVTGLLYCSVIDGCQQVYALDRAREWTHALALWCDAQPEMVAFTGTCLVHRAEVMQWHGRWEDAIREARRASERFAETGEHAASAAAFYRQGEIHRLRGERLEAEAAYRIASERGGEPQPGLALLWLARGRTDAACAALRRALGVTTEPLGRVDLLFASIEITLAAGDLDEARSARAELEEIAARFGTDAMRALSDHARAAVELAAGDAEPALQSSRAAWKAWQRLEAPRHAARARELLGLASRSLGDHDGSALELDAARQTYRRLGAAPDLARVDALSRDVHPSRPHSLSRRELEVLRLVASGKTNRHIASQLSLSVKTVDRHVSNVFAKLDVPTRAAATAYAYENGLV
jgi:DNA-binding CsgD family transcriptional regulator/tetratricopeptide (TPR) repeat protein